MVGNYYFLESSKISMGVIGVGLKLLSGAVGLGQDEMRGAATMSSASNITGNITSCPYSEFLEIRIQFIVWVLHIKIMADGLF